MLSVPRVKLNHLSFRCHERIPQLSRIFDKLTDTFKNPTPTPEENDRALEAIELIAPLSENDIAQMSYQLFHVVMQAPVSLTYSQEKKWEAARLTMHGAYKWDKFLSWVEDPQDIPAFLDYHFDLATRSGQNQDEPIQNALQAPMLLDPSRSKSSSASTRLSLPSYTVSISCIRTTSRSNSARPPSSSSLSSATDDSTPLTRSWNPVK